MRIIATLIVATCLCISFGCKVKNGASDVVEGWDDRNAPDTFGIKSIKYSEFSKASFRHGALAEQPWSDDYWPLNSAGAAKRYIDPEFVSKLPQPFTEEELANTSESDFKKAYKEEMEKYLQESISFVDDPAKTILMSPAEKYDIAAGNNNFGFTRHELNEYGGNYYYYETNEISWGWMGSCHGWAPAALMFEKPKHGVKWTNNDTKKAVTFVPGDIRGLLTKLAADGQTDMREDFMGTRCEQSSSDVVRNEIGRIVDGALGEWDSTKKEFKKYEAINILVNNWLGGGYFAKKTILFNTDSNNETRILKQGGFTDRSKRVYKVKVFSTKVDDNGDIVADELQGTQDFVYYKNCRDLNAGAFHITLARLLSKGATGGDASKAQGFVVDATKTDEVWNFPVYKFVTKMGKPTPLEMKPEEGAFDPQIENAAGKIVDPFKKYRHVNTDKIVDVYTQYWYGTESGPEIVYEEDDETSDSAVYHYTLELDKKGFIIGGEWHGKVTYTLEKLEPLSGAGFLSHLNALSREVSWSSPDSPDFIWRFKPGATLRGSAQLDADLIKKIHKCSVMEPNGEKVKIGEVELMVNNCDSGGVN